MGEKVGVDTQTLHLYWFSAWTAVMGVNASLSKQLSSLIQNGLVRTTPADLPDPGNHVDGWQAKWRELAYANSVLSSQLMHFSCSDPSTLFPSAVRYTCRELGEETVSSGQESREGVPLQASVVEGAHKISCRLPVRRPERAP
jgi:hypothetical protein